MLALLCGTLIRISCTNFAVCSQNSPLDRGTVVHPSSGEPIHLGVGACLVLSRNVPGIYLLTVFPLVLL